MILIKNILLVVIGLAGAGFVAAGTFAFITALGIIPRFAGRTGTAKYILLYENMIILGGTIGNCFSIFGWGLPGGGQFLLVVFGVFSGIFVGCLAIALAEIIQVFPVFSKRVNLQTGMPVIIIAIALGKAFGSLLQMLFQ